MGLFGDLFGGGGGGEIVTTNEPWDAVKPYLKKGFRGAEAGIFDRPLHYYPGSTVAPFSPITRRGLGAMMGRAAMGSALNPAAQRQVYDTLSGDYLTGPGMDRIQDAIESQVIPDVQSSFATAGRSGSALANEAIGRGIGRGMAPFIDAERGRMMQASQMAPGLAREDYYDIDRQLQAGNIWEQKYQQRLMDDVNRWNFYQNEPTQRMQTYMGLLQPGLGFGEQQQQGGGANPFLNMMGLGLTGLGVAGGLGWSPFG